MLFNYAERAAEKQQRNVLSTTGPGVSMTENIKTLSAEEKMMFARVFLFLVFK